MMEIISIKDSLAIQHLMQCDPKLGKIITAIGDLRYEYEDDSFAFLVETIVSQMLSKKAASSIYEKLKKLCGQSITPATISHLTVSMLRGIGISERKAAYINELAERFSTIPIDQFCTMTDQEVIDAITQLKGVGIWSAKMYLIFVLNRRDVLPFEDGAFLQVYCWLYCTRDTRPASVCKRCASWSPYSSIASRYLYIALDSGLTSRTKAIN